MNKYGSDSKVKKTLVRNFEQKRKVSGSGHKQPAILDMGCSSKQTSENSQKQIELDQPSLCSSEVLAHYLSDVKKALPNPLTTKDLNLDKCNLGAKATKKLNFHFNDKIYKNLIELNAKIDETKTRSSKRPTSSAMKRDLEPNIEDFCQDESEPDVVPVIPIIRHKFKPIRKIENGQLHKLIAPFEDL